VAAWALVLGLGVQVAARPAGADWSAPQTLSFTAYQTGGFPDVAVDDRRTAIAVWPEERGAAVRAAVRAAGGAWGAPQTLFAQPAETAPAVDGVEVETDGAGNAVAAWDAGSRVHVATRPAGGAWSAAEALPALAGEAFVAGFDLAVGGDGTAAALSVLRKAGGGIGNTVAAGVAVSVRPPGGAWTAPERLSVDGSGLVEVDGRGNVLTLLADATGVRSLTRPHGAGWSSPEPIADADAVEDVAFDGAGTAIAILGRPRFTVDERSGAVARLQRIETIMRPAGGAWGARELVSEGSGSAGSFRLDVNAAGDAVAAWERFDGEAGARVEAAARPAGGPWGAVKSLSDRGGRLPDVAIDAAGDGVVAWERQEADGTFEYRVEAAAYDADARAPGPAAGTPQCLPAPASQAARSFPGRVALTAAQLRINQRIGQAAIRRLNAVEDWLAAGIQGRDICGSAIGAAKLAPGIVTVLAPVPGPPPAGPGPSLPDPRPLVVAAAGTGGDPVRLSVAQLLISQRISQTAIRRAAALERRLSGRLTGGDLAAGALSQEKLAERLQVVRATPVPDPAPSRTEIAPPGSGGRALTLSAEQLRINQRIAQAAVRRANALLARLRAGLDGSEFADGAITAGALAEGVVRP
jgi:hypothetical protein